MPYTNKTQPTKMSPQTYLQEACADEAKRADAQRLIEIYEKATGTSCVMWNKIFGFGTYAYLDSKGGEHTYLVTGFALSSTGFTLYAIPGWETYAQDISNLGRYKLSGKSCLAIKRLSDIDLDLLEKIINKSVADMQKKYHVVL